MRPAMRESAVWPRPKWPRNKLNLTNALRRKTFELALESAGKIDNPYSKVYALGDIAKKLSEAGLRTKTHEVLDQAERLAEKIPQPDMQMQALQYIRSLMGKLPKAE